MRKGVNFDTAGVYGTNDAYDNREKSAIFVVYKSGISSIFVVAQISGKLDKNKDKMLATIDYISFAHNETRKSVPDDLKELWIRGLNFARGILASKNATESTTKGNFIERFLNKLLTSISNDFVTINLEFQAIHDKLIKGELTIDNPKEGFETIKKVIKLLTRADNFFTEIDYFGNETLKTELKSSLHTTYLIEVELKELVYKDKKSDRTKDELFSALAAKSKQSLSRAF